MQQAGSNSSGRQPVQCAERQRRIRVRPIPARPPSTVEAGDARRSCAAPDQVDQRIKHDPDNVDEAPVQSDHFDGRVPLSAEGALAARATQASTAGRHRRSCVPRAARSIRNRTTRTAARHQLRALVSLNAPAGKQMVRNVDVPFDGFQPQEQTPSEAVTSSTVPGAAWRRA